MLLVLLGGARGLARTDPAAAFLGGIKGDEATYIAIAASLAYDGDLRFAPEDLARFRDWYDGGPEGIFLKRGGDGALWFGKAFVHGALAAPFVRVFGFAGLLVFNVTCLLVVIAAGTWWLAPRAGTGRAAAFAAAFVAASVAPVYAAWLTSDLVTFTLVFCAFCLGVPRAGRSSRRRGSPARSSCWRWRRSPSRSCCHWWRRWRSPAHDRGHGAPQASSRFSAPWSPHSSPPTAR